MNCEILEWSVVDYDMASDPLDDIGVLSALLLSLLLKLEDRGFRVKETSYGTSPEDEQALSLKKPSPEDRPGWEPYSWENVDTGQAPDCLTSSANSASDIIYVDDESEPRYRVIPSRPDDNIYQPRGWIQQDALTQNADEVFRCESRGCGDSQNLQTTRKPSVYEESAVRLVGYALLRAISGIYTNSVVRRSLRSLGEAPATAATGEETSTSEASSATYETAGERSDDEMISVANLDPRPTGNEWNLAPAQKSQSACAKVSSPEWLLDVSRRIAAAAGTRTFDGVLTAPCSSVGSSRSISRCSSLSFLSCGDRAVRIKASHPSQSKLLWNVMQKAHVDSKRLPAIEAVEKPQEPFSKFDKTLQPRNGTPFSQNSEARTDHNGRQETYSWNAERPFPGVIKTDTSLVQEIHLSNERERFPEETSVDPIPHWWSNIPTCDTIHEMPVDSESVSDNTERAKGLVETSLREAVSSVYVNSVMRESLLSLASEEGSAAIARSSLQDILGNFDEVRSERLQETTTISRPDDGKKNDGRVGRLDRHASGESSDVYQDAREKFGSADDIIAGTELKSIGSDEEFRDAVSQDSRPISEDEQIQADISEENVVEWESTATTRDKSTQVCRKKTVGTDAKRGPTDEPVFEPKEVSVGEELPLESINYIKDQFKDVRVIVDVYRKLLYEPFLPELDTTIESSSLEDVTGNQRGVDAASELLPGDEAVETQTTKTTADTETEKDSGKRIKPSKGKAAKKKGHSKYQRIPGKMSSDDAGRSSYPTSRETSPSEDYDRSRNEESCGVINSFREKTTPDGYLHVPVKTKKLVKVNSPKPGKRARQSDNASPTSEEMPRQIEKRSLKSERRSPGSKRKSSGSDRRSPESERKSARLERKSARSERKSPGSERKSPRSEKTSPGSERKSPSSERKSPRSVRKSPRSERKSPRSERNSPGSERKLPSLEQKSPRSERKSPGSERKSPRSERKSPGSERKSPRSERKSPGSKRKSPSSDQKSPGPERKSPGSERKSPRSERKSPGSKRKSPSSDQKSPGPERKSPGSKRKSPRSEQKSASTERSPKSEQKSGKTERKSPTSNKSPKSASKKEKKRTPPSKLIILNENKPGTSNADSAAYEQQKIKTRISFFDKLSKNFTSRDITPPARSTGHERGTASGKHADVKPLKGKITKNEVKQLAHSNKPETTAESGVDNTPGKGIWTNAAFFEAVSGKEVTRSKTEKYQIPVRDKSERSSTEDVCAASQRGGQSKNSSEQGEAEIRNVSSGATTTKTSRNKNFNHETLLDRTDGVSSGSGSAASNLDREHAGFSYGETMSNLRRKSTIRASTGDQRDMGSSVREMDNGDTGYHPCCDVSKEEHVREDRQIAPSNDVDGENDNATDGASSDDQCLFKKAVVDDAERSPDDSRAVFRQEDNDHHFAQPQEEHNSPEDSIPIGSASPCPVNDPAGKHDQTSNIEEGPNVPSTSDDLPDVRCARTADNGHLHEQGRTRQPPGMSSDKEDGRVGEPLDDYPGQEIETDINRLLEDFGGPLLTSSPHSLRKYTEDVSKDATTHNFSSGSDEHGGDSTESLLGCLRNTSYLLACRPGEETWEDVVREFINGEENDGGESSGQGREGQTTGLVDRIGLEADDADVSPNSPARNTFPEGDEAREADEDVRVDDESVAASPESEEKSSKKRRWRFKFFKKSRIRRQRDKKATPPT